jgi:hypothetical protein
MLGIIATVRTMHRSKRVDRLADPKPFAAELYGPIVEVEISHPFRSGVQLSTFPNMVVACSFLAERFGAGGFGQIVLTAIDDPETPADVPDWWEAEKSAVEHAIEREHVIDAACPARGDDDCGIDDCPIHSEFTERGI